MGLGEFHRHRLFASVFALVGVLLYTALVPGHVISQAMTLFVADELGAPLEMSCHAGLDVGQRSSTPGEPSVPQKKCPFCKGYAPFMTALAGVCNAGALDAEQATAQFALLDDGQVQRVAGRPHNRGPPVEL